MIAKRRAKIDDPDRESLPNAPDSDPREVLDYLRKYSGSWIPRWVLQADVCDALTLNNWLWWEDRRRELSRVGREGQVEAVGANMFYLDRINQAKPGVYETKLEFTRLFNGACTRLGDKELNAAANSFVDQIKTNGVLKGAYETWMKQPPLDPFPDSVEGVPFVAS